MNQEKCLQCVEWSEIAWPARLWERLWVTGLLGLVLTVVSLYVLMNYATSSWVLQSWLVTIVMCMFGLGNLVCFAHGLAKRGWRGFHADLIGETIFLSVDVENRLHLHRHESIAKGPNMSKDWICAPCLMGYGGSGEKGRVVTRSPSTGCVKLNLTRTRRNKLYGYGALLWKITFNGYYLTFTDSDNDKVVARFPSEVEARAVNGYFVAAVQSLTETLRQINRYTTVAAIRQCSLVDDKTSNEPVAGKVGG